MRLHTGKSLGRWPRVNGARGIALLGFAGISLLLGLGFAAGPLLGEYSIWPPVPGGLNLAHRFGGLHFWGGVWLVVGAYALVGAFVQDQRKHLAAFAGMCGLWGTAYLAAFVKLLHDGQPTGIWLSAALFYSLLMSTVGTARMLNAPPLHITAIAELLARIERDRGRNAGGTRE